MFKSECKIQKGVLGTAQLGMRYGIANVTGQPDDETVTSIVSDVWSCGIRFFDTAQAYGSSEAALGRALAKVLISSRARVISKLRTDLETNDWNGIFRSVEGSVERLGIPRLWGMLLHSEEQLDYWQDSSLREALKAAKDANLVSYLGISVYSPERALLALEEKDLDIVQVPANLFDRRMERAGVFERARQLGKYVFVRSIYLQGLALMHSASVPKHIPLAAAAVLALEEFCTQHRLDRRHFAIDYVRRMAPAAHLIVGAETRSQALENCVFLGKESLDESLAREWTKCWPCDHDVLIDPRTWNSN
jgi:aryl-alcohol dehydrogenase-like predicted oxidoreductase